MDGTFEGLRFDYKADLFMKKPIALIGCMDLFSQRVQRTLSAEFPQNDIKFFDTLSAARTYAGDASPMSRFEMVLIDAPTFMDLMLDGTLSSTTEDGAKLAIAYENDAVHEHLLERYREAISRHGISLLPMHTTLEAWLCMLGLVGNGVQFVPASAALQSAHTASRAMASYDTQDESNEPLPRLTVNIRRRPRSGSVDGILLCLPVPWEQFWETRDGQVRQTGEDICHPCLRVDVVHLCRDDEGIHEGRPVAAALRACKKPRLSA